MADPDDDVLGEIDRLYHVAYGRPADPDGLSIFSARRSAGVPLTDLATEFLGSPEFAEKANGRTALEVLFRNALGRKPGPHLRKASPADMAVSLVADPDVIRFLTEPTPPQSSAWLRSQTMVERLYWTVLGRPADPDGLRAFTEQVYYGRKLVTVAEEFTSSAEFLRQTEGREAVAVLYINALGRVPDPLPRPISLAAAAIALIEAPDTVAYLQDERGVGQSGPDARLRIKAEIARLYQVVYGRPADQAGLDAFADQVAGGRRLQTLAVEFLGSTEFAERAAGRPPEAVLRTNAGVLSTLPAMPAAALAVALVRDPEVRRRLPVLPSMFPDGIPLEDDRAYRFWLEEMRTPTGLPPVGSGGDPLISLLVFVEDPDVDLFAAMVTSVLAQQARAFELVLVPVRTTDATVAALLGNQPDPRLRVCGTPSSWLFTTPLRYALAQCRGTFVCCLGQHDKLDVAAVAELAAAAEDADIVIADSDRLDPEGERHKPHLTAAWDPDLALASPPTGLVALRVAHLGRLRIKQRIGLGHACWDLLLQAAASLPRNRIQHLPAVLVSRADEVSPDPEAWVGLADAHLRATRQRGKALWDAAATAVRVTWPLPVTAPLVSVIVPTRDRADLLRTCVDGLLHRTNYPNLEILVVDNESREPATHALFAEWANDARVRVLAVDGPFNWSRLNNHAVQAMRGTVAVLLNNDTEVIEPDWLREMVGQALRPEIGAVGAKLLYPDGRVQHAGVVLGPNGSATHAWRFADGAAAGYMSRLRLAGRASAVTGACLALRRAVFTEVGGLDADALQVAWNDVDLCLKITAAGYDVLWTPYATMTHIEQASRGSDEIPIAKIRLHREQDRMRARWGVRLDMDPWLSPCLQLANATVHLAPAASKL